VTAWGVWLEDERAPVPGGGESVELQIDRRSGRVDGERRMQ